MNDWLSKRRLISPDKLALVDDRTGERLTYREFDERTGALARALRDRLGVQAGDRVAVLAKNRQEYFFALFAGSKLGAILVPLNTRLTLAELRYILQDCEPRVLLHDAVNAAAAAGLADVLAHRVSFDEDYAALVAGAPEARAPEPGSEGQLAQALLDRPYLILYTSGTTGRPKGAVLTHGSVTWNAVNTVVSWDLSSADVVVNPAPLFHTGGLNVFSLPLFHLGGTVVLMESFEASRVLELIERERATVFFGVPAMLQMMVESPGFASADLSSLRWVIAGGGACPVPVIDAFARMGVGFKQGYGLTEVGPNCFAISQAGAARKPGSVGFPIFHEDARIVDGEGRDVPPGEVGELILRGPHAFAGYWNNPGATSRAIVDGWVHTGDLVRQDAEGFFYIVDRLKDMYKSGGENVYPLEVERLIETHPKVAEVAVIGMPDSKWGEVGMVFAVLRPGESLTLEEMVEFLRPNLARYKLPRHLEVVSELPRNSTGKVQKEELRAIGRARAAEAVRQSE